MTDHNADGEIKASAHGDSAHKDIAGDIPASANEASLVPDLDEAVEAAAKANEASQAAVPAERQFSREITLQRLTPHSSWEDYAFRDEANHTQAANDASAASESHAGRRLSIAAIVAIAAAVGAIGGSLATVGVGHYLKGDQTMVTAAAKAAEQARATDSAIAKIHADIAALKSGASAQSAKLAERIEKVEKAQAEPAAKLAKLSETVEKLRAPAPVAAASAPETTGSIKPAAAQPNRLPTVEGWVLRDVYDGTATVVGRAGIFDVIPGDPLPGVGRVDAIRRQDGRWVVVTSRGLIVAR
ncbi:MAG: hypothetical protein BGN84_15595 [Afipia sp. 62-7]|nr:hypothetical protein [Afipia sp.]OJU18774.1 MAG: hypothetical protein BGN84_15595 [Afipia sp. 62-7]